MKLIIAIAVSTLCAGCAVTPMTDEERAQNDRLIQALQLMQTATARPQVSPMAPMPMMQPTAVLKNSYQSGANRICIYNRAGSDFVTTQPATTFCPPTQ